MEEDEFIEVDLLPLGPDLEEKLLEFERQGYAVWVGLHSIAQGMKLAGMFGL